MVYNFFRKFFEEEKESLILWLPVFFGLGIAVFFLIDKIQYLEYAIVITIIFALVSFASKGRVVLPWLFLVLTLIASGYAVSNARTLLVKTPILQKETRVVKVIGEVRIVQERSRGKRLILENVTIERMAEDATPRRVRVNITTKDTGVLAGDTVSTLAVLRPPPRAVIPGGYNFAQSAYYQKIGAVGYTVSAVEIVKRPEYMTFTQAISKLRQTVAVKIRLILQGVEGHIATALLVGDRGGIPDKVLGSIRNSGLAHLLAISGMHLALVAAIFFFSTRLLLAAFPRVALYYNIKKIAAASAILGSFSYLLISGSSISATRAFIMTTTILVAILIDRAGRPLRSVALAAFIILLFQPESLLTPSFQMSFAAVIALISAFDFAKYRMRDFAQYTMFQKFYVYVLSLILSSFIAGLATAPFAIYHFNHYSSYGILANLVAVPLTSFVIMPLGVIAMLFMPLGLTKIALIPMSWAINLMLKTADFVSGLPNSHGVVHAMPNSTLSLIVFGGLWLCLWKSKVRYYSIIPIAFGLLLMSSINKPDILINESGKLIAVRGIDDRLILSSKRAGGYTRDVWLQNSGEAEAKYFKNSDDPSLSCDKFSCIYRKNGYVIAISKHPSVLKADCKRADLLINLTRIKISCKAVKIISKYDLKKHGTHMVFLKNTIKIQQVD